MWKKLILLKKWNDETITISKLDILVRSIFEDVNAIKGE
jgi:hypothetical protein